MKNNFKFNNAIRIIAITILKLSRIFLTDSDTKVEEVQLQDTKAEETQDAKAEETPDAEAEEVPKYGRFTTKAIFCKEKINNFEFFICTV